MSYYTYNQYERMTSEDKDRICDNNDEIINDMIRERNLRDENSNTNLQPNDTSKNNKAKQPFKRQLTSSSQIGDNISIEEDDNHFIFVSKHNKRKQRRICDNNEPDDNDENIQCIDHNSTAPSNSNVYTGRTFINNKNKENKGYKNWNRNENSCHTTVNHAYDKYTQNAKNKKTYNMSLGEIDDDVMKMSDMNQCQKLDGKNKNTDNISKNDMNSEQPISQHALIYAVENQLPPIKIICEPKINHNQQGKEIVKALIEYIDKKFRQKYKSYKHPIGFDYWYVNKNGDLICFTKHPEMFVFFM